MANKSKIRTQDQSPTSSVQKQTRTRKPREKYNNHRWERQLRVSKKSKEYDGWPQAADQGEGGKRKMLTRRRVEPESDEETSRNPRRARRSERLYYTKPQMGQEQANMVETDSDGGEVTFDRTNHINPRTKVTLLSRKKAEAAQRR